MEVPGEEDGTRERGKRWTQFFPWRREAARVMNRVMKWIHNLPGENRTWTLRFGLQAPGVSNTSVDR